MPAENGSGILQLSVNFVTIEKRLPRQGKSALREPRARPASLDWRMTNSAAQES
jgi:hypothetical protein